MRFSVLLLSLWFSFAGNSLANQTCPSVNPSQGQYEKAIKLGFLTQIKLEQLHQEHGDRVVLLARIGSATPEQRFIKKLGAYWHYTHAGLAYHHHPNGPWTVVHLLNTCNKQSTIFAQGLMRFSLDNPLIYSNAIGRLTPALQQRLEQVVIHNNLAKALHSGPNSYSSVSHPYNNKYQNSNEYILDTLAAALAPDHVTVNNTALAKQVLLQTEPMNLYEPEQTKVKFWELIGKTFNIGPGNASLDDHSRQEKQQGKLEMVSVGSLFAFLQRNNLLVDSFEVHLKE